MAATKPPVSSAEAAAMLARRNLDRAQTLLGLKAAFQGDQPLGVAVDDGQGRTEFMRGHGHEVALQGHEAALVVQAREMDEDSPLRTVMVEAMAPLMNVLDDLTQAPRIGLHRPGQLADADVGQGVPRGVA